MKCLFKTLIVVALAVFAVHAIRDARKAHHRHQDADFTWVGFEDGSGAENSSVPEHKIKIQLPRRPPRPPRVPRPARPPVIATTVQERQEHTSPPGGTVLAEAEPIEAPAWFKEDESQVRQVASVGGLRTIKSAQKGDEQRAEADARNELNRAVSTWLAPDVPRTWPVPKRVLDSLIIDRHSQPVEHDYGTLHVQGYRVDFSTQRRDRIVEMYHRQLVDKRLIGLGGGLAFVLVCLAALSGYIRADEATKGYYTNKLRLAAAAAVGGAGVLCYQLLAHNV